MASWRPTCSPGLHLGVERPLIVHVLQSEHSRHEGTQLPSGFWSEAIMEWISD